jgi:hypothetical protein
LEVFLRALETFRSPAGIISLARWQAPGARSRESEHALPASHHARQGFQRPQFSLQTAVQDPETSIQPKYVYA